MDAENDVRLVYVGQGSSHSWTWLADLFEDAGMFDVRFLDSRGFVETLKGASGLVLISGGDGTRIATSIGAHGFSHMKGFIHQGGRYIGICAGAYLPLPSSVEPFSRFNLSTTKIENIDCNVRNPDDLSPRAASRYGSCAIVHPVRGEVEVDMAGKMLRAPLYGGPIFREPSSDAVLLRYRGFTSRTEYQLEADRARSMMLGRPAAISARHGAGELVLLGPHLEHPRYGDANLVFLDLLRGSGAKELHREVRSGAGGYVHPELASAIADLKVAILGLENRSFLVGSKLWDGSRFLELLLAIEKRVGSVGEGTSNMLNEMLRRAKDMVVSGDGDVSSEAGEFSELLVEAARVCVDGHFLAMSGSR